MEKRSSKPDTGAFVSPYLRRPLRTFEQFARDQAARIVAPSRAAIDIDGMRDDPHRNGSDDAKPNL